jgi:uncharacterized protein (TIRG00374 family)
MRAMRNFLIAVVLLLGVVFVFTRLAEVREIAATLRRGEWGFILLAFGLHGLWFVSVAALYRNLYRALGMDAPFGRLLLLAAGANFINIIAPTVGVGGMALFISEGRRRGFPAARVTLAGVLYLLFDYAGFLVVLAFGILVQIRRNNLSAAEIGAAVILTLLAVGIAVLLILGMRSGAALSRALQGLARLVNGLLRPFLHRDYLSEAHAHEFAYEAADGLREMRCCPRNLYTSLGLAFLSKLVLVSVLAVIFLAFGVPISIGTVIAGFSIGYLFMIISPTPAGLGVVEGALTLALNAQRIPLGTATVLTLAYRGVTFWWPLLLGMFAFRYLQHGPRPASVEVGERDLH